MENKELKHFGVLGMKWGRRTGSTSSGGASSGRKGGITNNKVFKKLIYDKDNGGFLRKDVIKRDIDNGKKVANSILNNKVFKAMIFDKDNGGFIRKDAVKGEVEKAKKNVEKGKTVAKSILNNKVFKALIYDKDNGGFIRKDAIKRDVDKVRDSVNRNQYRSGKNEIAKLRRQGKNKEADNLQKEVDSLFSPEEKKRYE